MNILTKPLLDKLIKPITSNPIKIQPEVKRVFYIFKQLSSNMPYPIIYGLCKSLDREDRSGFGESSLENLAKSALSPSFGFNVDLNKGDEITTISAPYSWNLGNYVIAPVTPQEIIDFLGFIKNAKKSR